MYNEDDLSLLDSDESLESPLDNMAPIDESQEENKPDVEEMLALLQAEDVNGRMIAARAFCELTDARATPFLIELLQDGCPLARVSAAYALGRNPAPEAVPPLIGQLELDWNGYVRKGIVWALGNCRDARAVQPLFATLRSDIPAVRLWAASSLGQVGILSEETAIAAIPALAKTLLDDGMPAVRSNCAWALGQICPTIPVTGAYLLGCQALMSGLQDKDLGVREDAKAILIKLGDPAGLERIEELENDGLL
jgi:HEAT repeat protein